MAVCQKKYQKQVKNKKGLKQKRKKKINRYKQIKFMQFQNQLNQPNFAVLKLTSDCLFYEMFAYKGQRKAELRIPMTLVCGDGEIVNWLFNSEKERNHPILKKRKENTTSIKIIRNFCKSFGFAEHIKQCTYQEEYKETIEKVLKQIKGITVFPYISVLYKGMKDFKNVKLLDFIKTMSNRSYSETKCPESWKLIQEKSYQAQPAEQIYYVDAFKPADLLNLKYNYLKRIIPEEDESTINEQSVFKLYQSYQNITKVTEQTLIHKMMTITNKIIDHIQHQFKLSVKKITFKCTFNKNKQCVLLGIINLYIKILEQYFKASEIRKKSQLTFQEFIKINPKLKEIEKTNNITNVEIRKKRVNTEGSLNDEFYNFSKDLNCNGELCGILLKNEIEKKIMKPIQSSNEVSQSVITNTRKNIAKILEKLKEMNLISTVNQDIANKNQESDSEIEQQKKTLPKISQNKKVCRKCYFIYNTISKTLEFDAKGILVENSLGLGITIGSKNIFNILSDVPIKKDYFMVKKDNNPSEFKTIPQSGKNFLNLNIESVKYFKTPKERSQNKIEQIKILPITTKQISINNKLKNQRLLTNQEQTPSKFRSRDLNQYQSPITEQQRLTKRYPSSYLLKKLPPTNFSSQKKQKKSKSVVTLPKIITKKNQQIKPIQQLKPILKKSSPLKLFENKSPLKKQYNLDVAIKSLLLTYKSIVAESIPEIKRKFKAYYLKQKEQNKPIEYLTSIFDSPDSIRNIYQFENNSPIQQSINKYAGVITIPKLSLQKLSQETGYPEIVMKNNFLVETIVCDDKTTIIYCVLTSEMFDNESNPEIPYQNILICHDVFDCFLEYLQIAKTLLENSRNKRIILYNQPGQSHTIFDRFVNYDIYYQVQLLDKILFRLHQRQLIDAYEDGFKFCGIGYGGYILQMFLISNLKAFKFIKKVLLVNSYSYLTKIQVGLFTTLKELYEKNQSENGEEAYILYSNVIDLNRVPDIKQNYQTKMLLNPITSEGRQVILKNILAKNVYIGEKYDEVNVPTTILYGEKNTFVKLQEVESFLFYKNNLTREVPGREILLLQHSGHDMKGNQSFQFQLQELLNY